MRDKSTIKRLQMYRGGKPKRFVQMSITLVIIYSILSLVVCQNECHIDYKYILLQCQCYWWFVKMSAFVVYYYLVLVLLLEVCQNECHINYTFNVLQYTISITVLVLLEVCQNKCHIDYSIIILVLLKVCQNECHIDYTFIVNYYWRFVKMSVILIILL